MKPQVSIIILNWNGYTDTSELLDSLKQIKTPGIKIIVVDNNSSGNDVELLETNYKGFVNVLKCDINLGFAGGNNIGIKYSLEQNADYILLLNNDTMVETNFLEPLLEKLLQDQQVGIAAPRINYYSEPNRVWSTGGKISKIRASGFADSDKLESRLSTNDREVDFVSGCCLLVRREMFEKIGLFDENYFLYVEDTDFCYRVKEAGYKTYVTPKSKIFHKVNSSTKKNNSLLPLYYTTRNRLYFAKKNFKELFPVTLLYIALSMSLKSLIWLFSGNAKNISAIHRAFKDSFSNKMGKTEHDYFTDNFIRNKESS